MAEQGYQLHGRLGVRCPRGHTRCFTQFAIGIFHCEDCCINGHSGMFHHVEGKPIWSHDRERQLEAERQGKGERE